MLDAEVGCLKTFLWDVEWLMRALCSSFFKGFGCVDGELLVSFHWEVRMNFCFFLGVDLIVYKMIFEFRNFPLKAWLRREDFFADFNYFEPFWRPQCSTLEGVMTNPRGWP